jgi:hypothetical protein
MKTITHSIGGQDRILDVGKMWFTKFFGESTSSDPLFMTDLLSKPDKQFDFICGLVYAGMNCHFKVINEPNLVTLEKVQEWVGLMDQNDAAALISKFAEVNQAQQQGEK